MQDDPRKNEQESPPVSPGRKDQPPDSPPQPVSPAETQGGDAAQLPNEEAEETIPDPAKPVDNPDLPEEGDSEDFDEEEVPEEDFTDDSEAAADRSMDTSEEPEEPFSKEDLPEGAHRSDYDEEGPSTTV